MSEAIQFKNVDEETLRNGKVRFLPRTDGRTDGKNDQFESSLL